jgi:hypothetical protein
MLKHKEGCGREADLWKFLRSNIDDPEIRAHADQCAVCRDTLAVAVWMQTFSATPFDSPALPNPTHLWWKAQVLRRLDAEQKAIAPIDVGERTIVIGAMLLLVWLWRSWQPLEPSAAAPASVIAVMITSGLLLTITAVVAVRQLIARD